MTKNKQKKQVSYRMWRIWYYYIIMLVEIQNDTTTLENSLAVSYKVRQTLTIKPSNIIVGIYSREVKTYVYLNIYSKGLITTLFLIAPN